MVGLPRISRHDIPTSFQAVSVSASASRAIAQNPASSWRRNRLGLDVSSKAQILALLERLKSDSGLTVAFISTICRSSGGYVTG